MEQKHHGEGEASIGGEVRVEGTWQAAVHDRPIALAVMNRGV
jgi:hypothetical protein